MIILYFIELAFHLKPLSPLQNITFTLQVYFVYRIRFYNWKIFTIIILADNKNLYKKYLSAFSMLDSIVNWIIIKNLDDLKSKHHFAYFLSAGGFENFATSILNSLFWEVFLIHIDEKIRLDKNLIVDSVNIVICMMMRY